MNWHNRSVYSNPWYMRKFTKWECYDCHHHFHHHHCIILVIWTTHFNGARDLLCLWQKLLPWPPFSAQTIGHCKVPGQLDWSVKTVNDKCIITINNLLPIPGQDYYALWSWSKEGLDQQLKQERPQERLEWKYLSCILRGKEAGDMS